MIFLIALAAALVISIFCSNIIRKHPVPFYIIAAGISAAVVICTWSHLSFPKWFGDWVWPLFARGALAGALFVIVMWIGAFPNGSEAMKLLMPVRAQLSIIACILTFGHNIAYGKTYFTALFAEPYRLPAPTLVAAVCSLIMIIILLPLFVTSFRFVREKMQWKNWKRLQRSAYLFYALLYCHVMLLTIPNAVKGRAGYKLTVFVYSLVFLSYLLCRIMKAAAISEKTTDTLRLKQAGGILCGAVMAGLILISVACEGRAVCAEEELQTLRKTLASNVTDDSIPSNPSVSETAVKTEPAEMTAADPMNTGQSDGTLNEGTKPAAGKYRDGVYTGSAKGNHGTDRDVEVTITVENDRILSIEITGFRDDEEFFSPAVEGAAMISRILEKQSPYVDVISGATESSEGLIRAVSSALTQARNK